MLPRERELLANRDQAGAWSVYADGLESVGESRAELMSLMLARESRPTAALAEAQAEFFAANKAWLSPRGNAKLTWRRGFVHEALCVGRPHDAAEAASQLATLLGHPSLQFVDTLRVDFLSSYDLEVLANQTLHCRRVALSGNDPGLDLARVVTCFPCLEWLELGDLSPATLQSATLRTLVTPSVNGLDLARLPALEQLVIPEVRDVVARGQEMSSEPWWSALRVVHLEAEYLERNRIGDDGQVVVPAPPAENELTWLGGPRPARLVIGFDSPPASLPAGVRGYSVGPVETAFVVLSECGETERRALANFARMSAAKGFAVQVAEAPGTGLHFCRLFGAGLNWGPRAAAELLTRRGAARASCLFISTSNALMHVWTAEGFLEVVTIDWSVTARREMEKVHGFDPGTALERGLTALDLAPLEVFFGHESELELLTELTPAPILPRDGDDEPITHDALDLGYRASDWEDADEDEYSVPEDDEALHDLLIDAFQATPAEVLAEGPVDWDDAWEPNLFSPPPDLGDPDLQMFLESEVEVDQDEASLTAGCDAPLRRDVMDCAVCHRVADLAPCVDCASLVCLRCSSIDTTAHDEDVRRCFDCGASGEPR